MPEPAAPDQQQYWNQNLDTQNLGNSASADNYNYQRELAFYFTPDQQYALEQMGKPAGKCILEIGAGLGTNSLYLASQGAKMIAMDIAHDRLALLRTRAATELADAAPRLHVIKAQAEHLPFRRDAFDVIYSKSVLIHTQIETVVPEINRTLKPGGLGTFIEPMTRNPFVNLYRRTLAPKIWQSIARYFGEPEFALFRTGFPSMSTRFFYLTGFLAFGWQFAFNAPQLFRLSLTPLNALDSALIKIPALAKRAWFAVIVVRK